MTENRVGAGRPTIAHFISNLHVGGAGRMLVKNVQSLNEHGFDNIVINLGSSKSLVPQIERTGAKVIHLRHRHSLLSWWTIIKASAVLRQHRCSVSCGNLALDRLIAVTAAKLVKIRSVTFFHWREESNLARSNKKHFSHVKSSISKFLLKHFCDGYLAVSDDIAKSLVSEGIAAKDQVKVLGAGVDLGYFHPPNEKERKEARVRLRIPNGSHVFLTVSRLHPVKNLENTVDAFSEVRNFHSPDLLLIVGPGDSSRLRQIAVSKGAENNVVFVGEVSDILTYLWASDSFLMFSFSEGRPSSLLEAISTGLIPVVSSITAFKDILGSTYPLMADPFCRDSIRDALMLHRSMSKPSELKLVDQLASKVSPYDQKKIGLELAVYLQELIEKGPKKVYF